jgi:hypothetical protein
MAAVALLVVIMTPASRQSIASPTPSETTGSTPQPNQGDVKSKPTLAEAPIASPTSQPAAHERSQQLLERFLNWREKANTTEAFERFSKWGEKTNTTGPSR